MVGVSILFLSVILGVLVGTNVVIPYIYSTYIAVAIFACLDSVFGAYVANISKKFNIKTFLSGFFCNAIIAMFLVYIGERLAVDIYIAVLIVFTTRLLNNFTIIRRVYIDKIEQRIKDKNRYNS